MTKMDAYKAAQQYGQDAAFVANLVINNHRNPGRKLKGLVQLLADGNEVRTAQFSTDTLLINGKQQGWEILESPGLVKVWC